MRASLLLSLCLLAASSAQAMQPAGPQETGLPRRRLERRSVPRRLEARAPLLSGDPSGFGDGSDTGTGTGTGTGTDPAATDSLSASISSSTSVSSTSTSTSSSTRTTSSSTRSSTTSSTSSTPTTSSTQSSATSASSVVMLTSTVSAAETSATAAPAQTSSADSSSSGGHTGLIVGVSVVGGIALIGALIFLYMKFGGRRFSDYQDDDADIKWPELKAEDNVAAMQPLPARSTGRAGFDMGEESDPGHEAVGGDAHSMTEYGGKGHEAMVGSTTALNASVGGYGSSNAYGHNADGYDDAGAYGAPQQQQGGVTGYYDQYPAYGHNAADGQQVFYPEQGGGHDYNAGGYGGAYGGGYDHTTSPPSNPYRVGGQGGY